MSEQTFQRRNQKNFLDIPSAALQVGYTPRHFHRIIEEDHVPVIQIGRKYFIETRALEAWKSTRREERLRGTIHQVGGWIKRNLRSENLQIATEAAEKRE